MPAQTNRSGAQAASPLAVGSNRVGDTVRVPKMAELVAGSLRRQIVQGDLVEDQPLPPEGELMKQFGVSRPTLREAFRVLESENLITVRRGAHGGARVMSPSSDVASLQAAFLLQHRGTTLADVYQARQLIEPAAARLLATKRTNAQLKALQAKVEEEASQLESAERQLDAPHSFHHMVVEFAGNQTLAVLVAMLDRIIERATASMLAANPAAGGRSRRRGIEVHRRLIELVAARDSAGAEQLWSDHLRDSAAQIVKGSTARNVIDLFD